MNRIVVVLGFIAAFALQALLLFWMIGDRAWLLARGTEIRLNVVPVDPRDILRGDYVVLAYDISTLDAHGLAGDDDFDWGDAIYVTLEQKGEAWQATAINRARPAGDVVLRATVSDVTDEGARDPALAGCKDCKKYRVEYGLEQFFVPEGKGRELELVRNDQRMQVDVAVADNGRAALRRLLVDGEAVYEDTLF